MSITSHLTGGLTSSLSSSITSLGSISPVASLTIGNMGLISDANNGTLVNTVAAGKTLVDWEGETRTALTNEIRYDGGRRVENFVNTPLTSWFVSGGASAVDNGDKTYTMSGLTATTDYMRNTALTAALNARSFRYSVELKGVGTNIDKQVRLYYKRVGGGSFKQLFVDVFLTDEFQYFTAPQFDGSASQLNLEIRIGGAATDTASAVDVRIIQLEEVTGQSIQNPSSPVSRTEVHNSGIIRVQYYDDQPIPLDYVSVYGDSLTDGLERIGSNFPVYLGYTYRTAGVTGDRLDQIRTIMLAEAPFLGTNIVLLEGGANDVFQAVSDPNAGMRSDMSLMVAHAIASSLDYIVYAIPPLGLQAGFTVDMQAWLESYNVWLKATYPDNYIDMYSLMQDPVSAGDLNPLYDSGDGVHFNSLGYRVVDQAARELINSKARISITPKPLMAMDVELVSIPVAAGSNFNQLEGSALFQFKPAFDSTAQVGTSDLVTISGGVFSLFASDSTIAATSDGTSLPIIGSNWLNGDDVSLAVVFSDAENKLTISSSLDGGATWLAWVESPYDSAFDILTDFNFCKTLPLKINLCAFNIYTDFGGRTVAGMQQWVEDNAEGLNCASAQFP